MSASSRLPVLRAHAGLPALLGLLIALSAIGCGAARETARNGKDTMTAGAARGDAPMAGEVASATEAPSAPAADGSAPPPPGLPRKIIYTAEVDLIVESFAGGEVELRRLLKAHGGFIASSNITGTPGEPRQGSWTLRVPVARFEAFMAAIGTLGELQRTHTDSQDVTEEYYDLGARLGNKQVEEKRLLEHLQRSTARLTDILAVEKELSRVRGEIEQIQGRLKLLTHQTELTTVTVSIREVKGYVAPKPPTFGTQIARTFTQSLTVLGEAGKAGVLTVVALVPWLFVGALVVLPLWAVLRHLGYRRPPAGSGD